MQRPVAIDYSVSCLFITYWSKENKVNTFKDKVKTTHKLSYICSPNIKKIHAYVVHIYDKIHY